jgi:DNA repair exonuclease SbcCD ATPase subunit
MSFAKLISTQINALNNVAKSLDNNLEKCWDEFVKLSSSCDLLATFDDSEIKDIKNDIFFPSIKKLFEIDDKKAKLEEERKLKKEREEQEKKEKALQRELEKKEREEKKIKEQKEKEEKKAKLEEERKLKKEREEAAKKEREEKKLREKEEKEEKKRQEEDDKKRKEEEKKLKKEQKEAEKKDKEEKKKSKSDDEKESKKESKEKTDKSTEEALDYFSGEPISLSDEDFWKWKTATFKDKKLFYNKKTKIACDKQNNTYVLVGIVDENKKLVDESEILDDIKIWLRNCGIQVVLDDERDVEPGDEELELELVLE